MFFRGYTEREFLEYAEQLNTSAWHVLREYILRRDNYTCKDCGKYKSYNDFKFILNTHHLYYQKGRYAWEYPKEAFITLCTLCHENRHKTETVRILNEVGLDLINGRVCYKCGGRGFFPEYRKIKHGVCFSCGGFGLIENFIEQQH